MLHTGEGSGPEVAKEGSVDEQGAAGDALRRLAVRAGIYVGVFLAGAIGAFLYSYIPLHGAKDWKIDYLEERLATKDLELEQLGEKLRQMESALKDVPDGDTFKVLQDELVTADKTVKSLEQQVGKLERRLEETERSRDQWKARHAEAEKARLAAREDAARPSPTAAEPPSAVPAAPAATSAIVSDESVAVGARWRSPDGKSDFDLVAIRNGRARVVPDASQLRPGVVPETRDVAPGERFAVAGPSGSRRDVVVKRIDGSASILIDVRE